jgi:hypothetical protein
LKVGVYTRISMSDKEMIEPSNDEQGKCDEEPI